MMPPPMMTTRARSGSSVLMAGAPSGVATRSDRISYELRKV
jgi:hypothetical protein